jgi:hypothetical protein
VKTLLSLLIGAALGAGVVSFEPSALAAQDTVAMTPDSVADVQKNRDLITRQELLQSAHRSKDLYQAVLSLRPHFISPLPIRTSGSARQQRRPRPPQVYVDGNLVGDVSVLRNILAESVDEVKFLSPTQAALEYGPEAAGGAILVKRHKDPKPQ